ncbi:MAG TPA: V-type ATPase subunit, partial [Spirochaetales bacterium]|nr:V-type ATPase subunit [Spirochaetales bacterium]
LRACEAALSADEARLFLELTRWVAEPVRSFFLALTLRFEVDRLKDILRVWLDGVARGGDMAGHAAYLEREPLVNVLDTDAMLVAADASQVAAVVSKTPYGALLASELPSAVERGNLFELELSLDNFYFSSAYAAAAKLSLHDRAIARRALDMDADAQNADRLNRFVVWYGMDATEAARYLLSFGSASGSLSSRVASMAGGAAEGKSGGELLRAAFRSMALTEARRLLGGYPFSVGIPLAYGTLRREETRVVTAILNAKYYGLSEERIREAL